MRDMTMDRRHHAARFPHATLTACRSQSDSPPPCRLQGDTPLASGVQVLPSGVSRSVRDSAALLDKQLRLKGQIDNDKWIDQAKKLVAEATA